jgi:peptidyl-prolyl cis-trans isomerase A (cyclophilin A)
MRLKAITLIAIASLLLTVVVGTATAQVDKAKLASPSQLTEKAPEKFQAKFDTSKGVFVIEVTRTWSPNGADRFYNLVKNGYYNDCRIFRVISGFMAQFGISGEPLLNNVWRQAQIKDDPVKESNLRSYVSFAMAGPNTRTTQLFINYADRNAQLDKSGFSPFGKVINGMDVVDSIYSAYGETPDQTRIQTEGNKYLNASFPKLDYIKTATIVAK